MSSRLIRPGDRNAARAIAWQPGNNLSARPHAGNPQADADREFEARVKTAYQQGFAAGQASGIQQASERIEPAAAAFHRIVMELSSMRKKFRADVEEDTVKLAIAIARRILHRELSTDPEAILGLVLAAFQKLNARETHRLRLSPPDAKIVQEHRSRFEFPEALEMIADPSLAPASAVFETSRGELDACVDTQLAEIQRGFTDLVKRRAR
jgi:flagellar assembly protein FliH